MQSTFSRTTTSLGVDNFRGTYVIMGVSALLVILWGFWFFSAEITIYETTPLARIEVSRASHAVQSPVDAQVVGTHLVLEKQVRAGELLVQLDIQALALALAEAEARQKALEQEMEALREEIAAHEQSLKLVSQVGQAALKEAKAKKRERQVAADWAEKKSQRLEPLLSEGHVPELDVIEARTQAERDKAALDAQSLALSRMAKGNKAETGDRQARLQSLRSEIVRASGEIAIIQAEIARIRHEIERRSIRAPVAGTLGEIATLVPGSYVKAGDILAAVVPTGELLAVAHFPPDVSLGRIRPGQQATLRLYGFPWTEYGVVPAEVRLVASEPRNGKVRVDLKVDHRSNPRIPLQHGLPGELEVTVEKLTPASLTMRAAGKMLRDFGERTPRGPSPAASPEQ